ncbi:MAG: hypothetical protein ABF780_02310 [Bifidobacterium aquikefiri]
MGFMLSQEKNGSEEAVPISKIAESIIFFCPFRILDADIEDLQTKLDQNVLGAVFNDRCTLTKPDGHNYSTATLINEPSESNFMLYSIKGIPETRLLELEEHSQGTMLKITVPDSNEASLPIYYRFRITGSGISKLVLDSSSKDTLLTNAFAKEEVIDFRLNDYRTLPLDISDNISENSKTNVHLVIEPIHFLLMTDASVDVDSAEELKERRLLEKNVWKNYVPAQVKNDVIAWHWKTSVKKPSDGYRNYIKLRLHEFNVRTILIYLSILIVLTIGSDIIEHFLFSTWGWS